MYIHEYPNWTDFTWQDAPIAVLLDQVTREQGKLQGRLSLIGFRDKLNGMAESLAGDITYSSEIEGIRLNHDEVRSSVARRLGLETQHFVPSSHYVDGLVAVMVNAMENSEQPLTKEILCGWQTAFFPLAYSEGQRIEVGKYRTHGERVVSGGYLGRERVHYVAPAPERVEAEMEAFIDWFNAEQTLSPVIKSAIAHFRFVTIHPFEDGNGRLSRILGDIILARAEQSHFRFYTISTEINRDKRHYYEVLERTQRGKSDLTDWIVWYLQTLLRAVRTSNQLISSILNKSVFWLQFTDTTFSERERKVLNSYLDGYEAKITTKKWAELGNCSRDSAARDIDDLICKGVLAVDVPDAKRPSYSIVYRRDIPNLENHFTEVAIKEQDGRRYLTGLYSKCLPLSEQISELDAERFTKGELPLRHLLMKYCAYLLEE